MGHQEVLFLWIFCVLLGGGVSLPGLRGIRRWYRAFRREWHHIDTLITTCTSSPVGAEPSCSQQTGTLEARMAHTVTIRIAPLPRMATPDEAFMDAWRMLEARCGITLSYLEAQYALELEQCYGVRFGTEMAVWHALRTRYHLHTTLSLTHNNEEQVQP